MYCKFNSATLQLFTSSLYLAAAFSALGGSYATRRWGRRTSMISAGVLDLIGISLQVGRLVSF